MTGAWATTRTTAQWLQVISRWRVKTRLRLRRNSTPAPSEEQRPSEPGPPPSRRPSGKQCCAPPPTAWSRSSTYPSCLPRCCEPCRTSQRSSPWSLQVTLRSSRRLSFWAACASGRRAPRLLRAAGRGTKRRIQDRKRHTGSLHYSCVLWLAPTNREDQCLKPQTHTNTLCWLRKSAVLHSISLQSVRVRYWSGSVPFLCCMSCWESVTKVIFDQRFFYVCRKQNVSTLALLQRGGPWKPTSFIPVLCHSLSGLTIQDQKQTCTGIQSLSAPSADTPVACTSAPAPWSQLSDQHTVPFLSAFFQSHCHACFFIIVVIIIIVIIILCYFLLLHVESFLCLEYGFALLFTSAVCFFL